MLLELCSGAPLRHCHQGPRAKEQVFFLMTKINEMYNSIEVKTHYQGTCILVHHCVMQASYLSTLCLDFLIYKVGITEVSTSSYCLEDWMSWII